MNMKSNEFEKQMLDYLDGAMTKAEQHAFEDAVNSNAALKRRFDEYRSLEGALKKVSLAHPSKNFTDRVMQNLENYPLQNRRPLINGLFLLCGILLMAGLCVFLSYAGFFDTAKTTIDLDEISVVKKYLNTPLPSIPFDGKIFINIVIFLNLILALMIFDRVILRALFQGRMRQG
jgi:hypothetical protein